MTRTKDMWAEVNYPPTENQIKYNTMMLNYEIFDEIVYDVCTTTRTHKDELFNKTKDNHVTSARYLIYYLAKLNGYRLSAIVRCMKADGFKTTNSTIIYGIKETEKKINKDPDLAKYIKNWNPKSK